MSKPVILRCSPVERARYEGLAQRLGLAWEDPTKGDDGLVLEADASGLSLRGARSVDASAAATRVDFCDPALLYRLRTSGRRQGLGQALGLQKYPAPTVLDATAGLGKDALLMAHLGCTVQMLERSPLVHALLEDGLARACSSVAEPLVQAAVARLALQHGEARDWLAEAAAGARPRPDIVYLDPMFPPRDKSARVKKDIAVLQEVLGAETDFPSLLQAARAVARLRVVVKRPGSKSDAALPLPTFTVPGKTAHFEVYVSSSASSMR